MVLISLSWMEEKELVDLFYLYKENTYIFPEEELYEMMFVHIQENQVLKRLTQQRLEDIILENPSFCTIFKVMIKHSNFLYSQSIH